MHDFFQRRRVRAIAVAASALAMAGGGLAAAQTAGAASQRSAPFNQCPSIGSSPSCEILLVVNSDNSITVLNDSSVGTFDGSDDTLVGIVNNSSAAVKAITVAIGDSFSSGEGNPPFIQGTNTTSHFGFGTTNQCHRSAAAYGPQIQADESIQASDFVFKACSGAIMADFVADLPGANAQWDEGPQLDEIAPAGQPSDSTGMVTLSVGGNDVGFPFVMKACVNGLGNSSTDASCQAEIKTELGLGTKLLKQGGTILLDTKDNSYVFCDKACVAQYSPQSTKNKNSDLKVVTVPSLAGLYALVHQRAPQAEIRVLQYPHLFPAKPATSCTVASLFNQKYVVDQTEMNAINSAGDTLDGIIASAVATASSQGIDIQAVDTRSDFAGHEVCSSAPWINALEPSNQVYSFHPNAIGQQQFASLFEAQL
jgi:hypothetical protein